MSEREMERITIDSVKACYDGAVLNSDMVLCDDVRKLPLATLSKRMDCMLFALCLEGTAEYMVDTVCHKVKGGDIMIISSGQVTENYRLSDDCRGLAIFISERYFLEVVAGVKELSSLFVFSRSHPVFSLSPRQVCGVEQYFQMIRMRLEEHDNHFRRDIARGLMQALVYEMSNIIWQMQAEGSKGSSRAEALFANFIRMVEDKFRVERRVHWYARQLNITSKYLSEIVRQVSHRTPNEWIDHYVEMELRVLLKNTTLSIKEIADKMHFANQSFLGKFFKAHVGVSPLRYRKGMLK